MKTALNNSQKIGLGVVAFVILCHVVVALKPKVGVSGLFLAKPANPGYIWIDNRNSDSRLLWQISDVQWQAGLVHPDFKVESGEQEGVWNPQPGYAFVDKAQGLATVWKTHLKHPDYMAWSDDAEGQWLPVTGYKFVYEGDTFVDTVWDPNKRYDDVKVISLAEKDHYQPFPGYTFVEPGQSLRVVWTPGTVNRDNHRLIAGRSEGTWDVNAGRTVYRRGPSGRDSKILPFAVGVAVGVGLGRVLR